MTQVLRAGMTCGMKVAVSIPDDLFEEVERMAEERGGSRSALYANALREFVVRHSPDRITEAINVVADAVGNGPDPFLVRSARRLGEQIDW